MANELDSYIKPSMTTGEVAVPGFMQEGFPDVSGRLFLLSAPAVIAIVDVIVIGLYLTVIFVIISIRR